MTVQFMRSPSLHSMQMWLRWMFTDPRGVTRALTEIDVDSKEPEPRLSHWLVGDVQLPLAHRLSVYSNAYFVRLLEVLGSNFTATKRILGEDNFRILVAEYLMENPSHSPSIEEVGQKLPDFLQSHRFSEEYPFLSDLAKLEWMVLVSLYTNRLPRLDMSVLHQFSPEGWPAAHFGLDPTVFILETAYNVIPLWNDRFVEPKQGADVTRGAQFILVHRDDEWVQVRSLSSEEAKALQLFRQGKNLGAVCRELEKTFEKTGETANVDAWFSDWVQSGVIKKIQF